MRDYSGKSIIIVAGGLLQVPAVKIAHELGLQVIVTDRNPACACHDLADVFAQIDTKDVDGHIAFARTVKGLAGVFVEGASVEMTAAGVAEELGLPGIGRAAAYRIANKAAMRMELAAVRIPQPKFWASSLYSTKAHGITPPFVVKATDSSGSRGLTKCYQMSDFTEAVFKRAQAASGDKWVLIEELLQPDPSEEIVEQSVETVWHEGVGHWLNWVDRPFLDLDRYAIEIGHFNPALHSAGTQRQVEQMVLAAGKALGMTTGIFKADVMLTKDGPRILETTARLSGGFDAQYTTPLAHGANYIRGAMKLALGEPIDWDDFMPKHYRHAVAMSAFPKPGRVTRIVDKGAISNGALLFQRVQPGDIIPDYTTCVDRPLFVVTSGDSRGEAVDRAKDALAKIQVETEAL